ncbi:MAG: hypothetical protein LBB19_00120 [Puniceicoccales bacterium]|jgi:hypothetical protein|nr:hypothetical protein [Puniceicoccales bacterium]
MPVKHHDAWVRRSSFSQVNKFIGSFIFFFFIHVSWGREINLQNIHARISAIKSFTPWDTYQIDFECVNKVNSLSGSLVGRNEGREIHFIMQTQPMVEIIFDKLHPENLLRDGVLYPASHWLDPIVESCGCCYFMIAMPFLDWELINFEQTAKRGRKVLKCCLLAPENFPNVKRVVMYIDENFNTLMEAYAYNYTETLCAQLVLQSFKKLDKNTWHFKSVLFTCGQWSSKIQVIRGRPLKTT